MQPPVALSETGRGYRHRISPEKDRRTDPSGKTVDETRSKVESAQVVDDASLVRAFNKVVMGDDISTICTDRFINRSKDTYNADWLVREIAVQNWVDHNADHPATMDGVDISIDPIDEQNTHRITIEAPWPIDDPTGFTYLHSEKPSGPSAGGNGIGLKQGVLRFLRDFSVRSFRIEGNGFDVDYDLQCADSLNPIIQDRPEEFAEELGSTADQVGNWNIRHDWLIGRTHGKEARPTRCAYVIETDDPELLEAFSSARFLGAGSENPYLAEDTTYYLIEETDDESGATYQAGGGIRWLPPEGETYPEGACFINGQYMNIDPLEARFSRSAPEVDYQHPYWRGPAGVTLDIRGLYYEMSVDRPPFNGDKFKEYAAHVVDRMPKEARWAELKKAQPFWENCKRAHASGNDTPHAFFLIALIARAICFDEDESKHFRRHFEDERLVAYEYNLSKQQEEWLESQGYILCFGAMERAGMPKASEKLDLFEQASNNTPSRVDRSKEARSALVVETDELSFPSSQAYLQAFTSHKIVERVEPNGQKKRCFRFHFPKGYLDKEILAHPLSKTKTPPQVFLKWIRSMAFLGIEEQWIESIIVAQGEEVTTHSIQRDRVMEENQLLIRNTEARTDEAFIEIILSESLNGVTPEAVDSAPKSPETKSPAGNTAKAAGEPEADDQLKAVPIQHPTQPAGLSMPGETIVVKTAPKTEVRQGDVDEKVVTAVEKLEKAVEQARPSADREQDQASEYVKAYLAFRDEQGFYGQIGSEYISGTTLMEIFVDHHQAKINTKEAESASSSASPNSQNELRQRLKRVVDSMETPEDDDVQDFDIVLEPSPEQIAQLGLLREFVHLVGVSFPNDLFVYEGTGSYGINIGQKAIGLHSELLKRPFPEIIKTLWHEIAHNAFMDHKSGFIKMDESLEAKHAETMTEIALIAAEKRTPQQQRLLEIHTLFSSN